MILLDLPQQAVTTNGQVIVLLVILAFLICVGLILFIIYMINLNKKMKALDSDVRFLILDHGKYSREMEIMKEFVSEVKDGWRNQESKRKEFLEEIQKTTDKSIRSALEPLKAEIRSEIEFLKYRMGSVEEKKRED